MAKIIPQSIGKFLKFASFDAVAEARLNGLDLTVILVKLIDTCTADVLPFLAEEFNVLGYKGWHFADTDAKKRQLLKDAIILHQHAGTPYAIKTALAAIGYPNAIIVEHLAQHYHNGQYRRNGTISHSSYSWAQFKVIIPMPQGGVGVTLIADVKNIVEAWKRKCCHLVDVSIGVGLMDHVTVTDSIRITRRYIIRDTLGHHYHNGQFLRDGSINRANNYDSINLTMI